jgi:hypothetical protein
LRKQEPCWRLAVASYSYSYLGASVILHARLVPAAHVVPAAAFGFGETHKHYRGRLGGAVEVTTVRPSVASSSPPSSACGVRTNALYIGGGGYHRRAGHGPVLVLVGSGARSVQVLVGYLDAWIRGWVRQTKTRRAKSQRRRHPNEFLPNSPRVVQYVLGLGDLGS